MKERQILILEDNKKINAMISDFVKDDGFNIIPCLDYCDVEKKMENGKIFCLIIQKENFSNELYKFIQDFRIKFDTLLFIISSQDSEDAILKLFSLGIDFFIKTPISSKLLFTQLNSILKRVDYKCDKQSDYGCISFRDFEYFKKGSYLLYKEEKMKVAELEIKVLELLLENSGKRLSTRYIFEKVWGKNGDISTVGVHISRLKNKIEKYEDYKFITNSYKNGYEFDDKYVKIHK